MRLDLFSKPETHVKALCHFWRHYEFPKYASTSLPLNITSSVQEFEHTLLHIPEGLSTELDRDIFFH
jgi:hypothetical protein